MAICTECPRYGINITCENDNQEGLDKRIAHTRGGVDIEVLGRIARCQIRPLLPIIAESFTPKQPRQNDYWQRIVMESWKRPSY